MGQGRQAGRTFVVVAGRGILFVVALMLSFSACVCVDFCSTHKVRDTQPLISLLLQSAFPI